MSQKIKKCLLFILPVFYFLFAPAPANAQLGETIAVLFATYLVSFIIKFILQASAYVLGAAAWILNWVLSEHFIAWSYTGTDNPIIDVGWGLTRDLTNMLFVIVLAFVGLASALDIGGFLNKYKWQKILPGLIAMALLINFTPVICGVIVDASNIIMNFFLSETSGIELAERQYQAQFAKIDHAMGIWVNPLEKIGAVFQAIIMIFFNLYMSLTYILYAFLFAARYVAIWILVILSPPAFFASVIPDFKNVWKDWWKNFFQWCFVGINAAFFIYLGNHIMIKAHEMVQAPPPSSGFLESALIQTLQSILPMGMAMIFLNMGFLLAMKGGTKEAEQVIKGFKYARTGATAAAGGAAGWGASKMATSEPGRRFMENLSKGQLLDDERWKEMKEEGGVKRAAATGAQGLSAAAGLAMKPLAPAFKRAAEAGLKYSDEKRKEIEEAKKDFTSSEQAKARVRRSSPGDHAIRIAYLEHMREEGKLDEAKKDTPRIFQDAVKKMRTHAPDKLEDLFSAMPELLGSKDQIEAIIEEAEQEGWEGDELMENIKAKLPDTGKIMLNNLIKDGLEDKHVKKLMELGKSQAEAYLTAPFKKIAEGLKTSDIEDMKGKDLVENEYLMESIGRFSPAHITREVAKKGGDVAKKMKNKLDDIGAFELKKTNPQIIRLALNSDTYRHLLGGGIKGAESKDEYKFLDKNFDYVNQVVNMTDEEVEQKKEEVSRDIQSEIKKVLKEEQTGVGTVQQLKENIESTKSEETKNRLRGALQRIEKVEEREGDEKFDKALEYRSAQIERGFNPQGSAFDQTLSEEETSPDTDTTQDQERITEIRNKLEDLRSKDDLSDEEKQKRQDLINERRRLRGEE